MNYGENLPLLFSKKLAAVIRAPRGFGNLECYYIDLSISQCSDNFYGTNMPPLYKKKQLNVFYNWNQNA